MKKELLTLIFGFFAAIGFSQELNGCATYTMQNKLFADYPELQAQYDAYQLLKNAEVETTVNGKTALSYEIPVVFHILHEYGNENISDAQVYDAMEVINREFNAADGDSVDLVPEFENLNGNARITFKLAALDPFGNCTNGIEHIYSHESRVGDAYSKLNQWNRSQYMNIWVVDVVGTPGAAAYATLPAGTDGNGFWVDGVLSRHTYVGSTGTANPGVESVITHEIGHWLGLAHTFGNSDLINDGPTVCNDDGIQDTPPTKGHQNCNFVYPTEWIDCTPGVVEDLQNYMDYSYCDRHFTPGQCAAMSNILQGISGQRNHLWKDSTLEMTGIKDLLTPQDPSNQLTVPLCAPVADFYASKKTVCAGTPVTFTDKSWNGVIESREWIFQDGTPATATTATANVTFSGSGWKKVTLIASNAAGSDVKEESHYIYVSGNWAETTGPTHFDMESTSDNGKGTDYFLVQNVEENYGKFKVVDNAGYNGTKAFKLQTYLDISNADPFTDLFFYNDRLGLSVDNLITPSVDLRYTTNVSVSFKFAYATNATSVADITEKLRVFTSSNCGETWSPKVITVDGDLAGSTITGDKLVTAGYASNSDFTPTSNSMWSEGTFNYSVSSNDVKMRIKFEFEASDNASNLFIDDIQINGTLSNEEVFLQDMEINVYPNPISGEDISVSFYGQNAPTQFTLRDVQGKVILQNTVESTEGFFVHQLENTSSLDAACYFLEISSGGFSTTKKVVVL